MGMGLLASAAAFFGVLLIVLGFFQARGRAWAARTRTQLERAGLALKLHEYVALRVLVGLLALVVVFSLGNRHALAFLGGLAVAAVASLLPPFYVRLRIIRQ